MSSIMQAGRGRISVRKLITSFHSGGPGAKIVKSCWDSSNDLGVPPGHGGRGKSKKVETTRDRVADLKKKRWGAAPIVPALGQLWGLGIKKRGS